MYRILSGNNAFSKCLLLFSEIQSLESLDVSYFTMSIKCIFFYGFYIQIILQQNVHSLYSFFYFKFPVFVIKKCTSKYNFGFLFIKCKKLDFIFRWKHFWKLFLNLSLSSIFSLIIYTDVTLSNDEANLPTVSIVSSKQQS